MKPFSRSGAAKVAALLLSLAAPARAQVQELSWPRTLTANDGMQVTFYQPQVDSWEYYAVLDYHMAVELQFPGATSTIPAALTMTAQTSTDMGTRTVALYDQKIVSINFPGTDPSAAQQYRQTVQSLIPTTTMNLSLDQVLSYMNQQKTAAATSGAAPASAGANPAAGRTLPTTIAQTAPPIFYSTTPAILVTFQGAPGFAPVTSGSQLFFSVNTNWALFQDKSSGIYYLQDQESWIQSTSLNGQWQPATQLPSSILNLPANGEWDDVKQNIPGITLTPSQVPTVFTSQTPAEMILLDGPAQLQQISGTSLQWVTNTQSDLFYYTPSSTWYFLVAGRWFSAASLNGPWTYATPSLPADFANIPTDSPRAAVLASVPGTPEAAQAVAMAQMPHKADVDIATTNLNVVYGGPPQFSPITGTQLQYATNTSYQVIQVNSTSYYACNNAVWFTSGSPNGPWVVATMVPQVIYTIPATSPMYNVTYVQVYSSTPTTVVYGYTAGYQGSYVAAGVVMLGVGVAIGAAYYHPYYPPGFGYPVYYHPPYPYYGYGYHAAYNPYTGAYAHGYTAYGPYGTRSAGTAYNPSTGTYARGASASGVYGSAGVAQAYNPYTGAKGETYQQHTAYGSYGQSVASKNGETAWGSHASNAYGSAGQVSTSEGGHAAGVSTAYGNTAAGVNKDGDAYATHDGNVYKNTGSGWQSYNNGSWNNVNKPSGGWGSEVDNDQAARAASSAGNSDFNSWRGGGGGRYSGGSAGGWGGGGGGWSRGGGGGRR